MAAPLAPPRRKAAWRAAGSVFWLRRTTWLLGSRRTRAKWLPPTLEVVPSTGSGRTAWVPVEAHGHSDNGLVLYCACEHAGTRRIIAAAEACTTIVAAVILSWETTPPPQRDAGVSRLPCPAPAVSCLCDANRRAGCAATDRRGLGRLHWDCRAAATAVDGSALGDRSQRLRWAQAACAPRGGETYRVKHTMRWGGRRPWARAALVVAIASSLALASGSESGRLRRAQGTDEAGDPDCLPDPVGEACVEGEMGSSCALLGWCGTSCYTEVSAEASDATWCGDGACNAQETCETCADDCGPCQPRGRVDRCVVDGEMSLTFDDGPSEHTARLLDLLKQKRAPAAFFVLGYAMDAMGEEGSALVARAAAEGHLVASHTYAHLDLSVMAHGDLRADLSRADAALRAATCARPRVLRAPQGILSEAALDFVQDIGYRVVHWNLDTRDWEWADDDPLEIVRIVQSTLDEEYPSGIISLQHDTRGPSVDLVGTVIDLARAKGYTIVPLERCISPNATRCLPGLQRHDGYCAVEAAGMAVPTDDAGSDSGDGGVSSAGANDDARGGDEGDIVDEVGQLASDGWSWVEGLPLAAGVGVVVLALCVALVLICAVCSACKRKRTPQSMLQGGSNDSVVRLPRSATTNSKRASKKRKRFGSARSRNSRRSQRLPSSSDDDSGHAHSERRQLMAGERGHDGTSIDVRRVRTSSMGINRDDCSDVGKPPEHERQVSLPGSVPGSIGDVAFDLESRHSEQQHSDAGSASRAASRVPSRAGSGIAMTATKSSATTPTSSSKASHLRIHVPKPRRGRAPGASSTPGSTRSRSRSRLSQSSRVDARRRRRHRRRRAKKRGGSATANRWVDGAPPVGDGSGGESRRSKSPGTHLREELSKSSPSVLDVAAAKLSRDSDAPKPMRGGVATPPTVQPRQRSSAVTPIPHAAATGMRRSMESFSTGSTSGSDLTSGSTSSSDLSGFTNRHSPQGVGSHVGPRTPASTMASSTAVALPIRAATMEHSAAAGASSTRNAATL